MVKKNTSKLNTNYPFSLINKIFDNLSSLKNFKSSKKAWLIILVLGLLLLGFYKKSWFVAATVNGVPITNLELQLKLNQQFRSQILNQLVNEKIIMSEAAKFRAIPTEEEINKKITELEANVGGGQILDNLLSQQGQTRVSLIDQLKVQLAISNLYDKEASVSGREVEKFIEENKQTLQATDSGKQREEAYDFIKQQKISQIFNQKFQELRQKAKIQIF